MTKSILNLIPRLCAVLLIFAYASCDSMQDKGTAERPVNIPEEALPLLDGKVGFVDGRGFGSIYNGSDWVISDIDVLVTKTATNEGRKFRLRSVEKRRNDKWKEGDPLYLYTDAPLKPFSTGEVDGSSGDFTDGLKKEDFSWAISSARGHKP
jgi:predicted nucleotidyltransferase